MAKEETDAAVSPDKKSISDLASAVIKKWEKDSPDIWNKRNVTSEDVKECIAFLAKNQFLGSEKITASAAAVDMAIKAIKEIQDRLNLSEKDGIFGKVTKRAMSQFLRDCDLISGDGEELSDSSRANKFNRPRRTRGLSNIIFYFVEDKLKGKVIDSISSMELLADAWQIWQLHIDLTVRLVPKKEDANVVITEGQIDGPGNTLGLAHIGGPHVTTQLTLTLDDTEPWTKETFVGAATHEIGHILGLSHTNTPNQLMNPVMNIDSRFWVPGSEDISKLQDKWGVANPKSEAFERPTPAFLGDVLARELGI